MKLIKKLVAWFEDLRGMRIKDKTQFVLGIINLLIAITGVIILIAQHRIERLGLLGLCFVCGITGIITGIETKAQRQKRKEEIQAKAKMYGWCKDGDINEVD